MSKEVRKIVARGLTKSNIGALIRYNGRPYIIDNVGYDAVTGTTEVTATIVLSIPNMTEISIVD